jgi:hypothetical protein
VAVRGSFVVAAAVISDAMGNVILAATQELHGTDSLQGEALVALLTVQVAVSFECTSPQLEGDALLVELVINNPSLISSWYFVHCISYIW